MKVRILDEAENEARQTALWYEKRKRGLGIDFLGTYADALATIESHPHAFPRMETLSSTREIRRCVLHRFPYLIVYEIRTDEVIVLAVAHSGQRPNYWLGRGG